jgi:hypothetical protein
MAKINNSWKLQQVKKCTLNFGDVCYCPFQNIYNTHKHTD